MKINSLNSVEKLLSKYVGLPNLRFMELGSGKGQSALWLAENILTGENSQLICVDIWDVHQREAEKEIKELKVDHLYDIFINNTQYFRHKIIPERKKTAEALKGFCEAELKFEFIWVDANHTKEEVYEYFSWAYQCIKPEGIIFFDEPEWQPVQRALGRISRDYKVEITEVDGNGAYYCHKPEVDRKEVDDQKTGVNHPVYFFLALNKIYLASADQFKGMEAIVEEEEVLQCQHFYSVVGGLGGLNVLARLKEVESITFFDINPYMLLVAELMIEIIRNAEDRNTFISLIYGREFDAKRYSFANQRSYYELPIDPKWSQRLERILRPKLFERYKRFYWPYIQNPMDDSYDGVSIHCTRLLVFHEAPINGVMTYPFLDREQMRVNNISCINSFFFGKGWLRNEDRYQRVRQQMRICKIKMLVQSIFDIEPPDSSGLYASNVLDGTETEIYSLIERLSWMLWYSGRTNYLQMEYVVKSQARLIPFEKVYGKGITDTHQSCCQLLDANFDLNATPFMEVIQPHVTEGMNYGFRFYGGQRKISVQDFMADRFSIDELPEIIGIHILMGGGCQAEVWKQVVSKAVELGKTLFVFEHRKECTDWPEWDVNPQTIIPELEIDKFLLSLDAKWSKYGTANIRGDTSDIRNICWIMRREELPFSLRQTNLIAFPDWSESEEDIYLELSKVMRAILQHPNKGKMTLLIDTSNKEEEAADLVLSSVVMNIIMEEDLDVDEGPEISLVGQLNQRQWSNLLPRLKYKIVLDKENKQIAEARVGSLQSCGLERFVAMRFDGQLESTKDRIYTVLQQAQKSPDSPEALMNLQKARQEVAALCLEVPAEQLRNLYLAELGQMHQKLLDSGIREQPLTETEGIFVQELLEKQAESISLPEWEYIPEGWAKKDSRIKGWNVQSILDIRKRNWSSYLGLLESSEPVANNYGTHNTYMSYGYVLALAARKKDRVAMLDWGGGIGDYYLISKALLPEVEIDYHCKEMPLLCQAGLKLLPEASFYENDEDCFKQNYDLVLASSSLQYSEDWQGVVQKLAGATRSYLYITRMPIVHQADSFVVLQRPYQYGYQTEYLGWFLNRQEFLEFTSGLQMELVREFAIAERYPVLGAPEQGEARGFLFRRKQNDSKA